MKRRDKIALILAGYALAVVVAFAAGWLYNVRVASLPNDTSGGMYAGGEFLQSLGAFFFVAIFPTALGLWFLRRHVRFWNAVAMAALVFAALGAVVVLAREALGTSAPGISLGALELFRVAQLVGAPVWCVAFALFAVIAPTPGARRKLAIAVVCEAVIGACFAVHLFAPNWRL